MTRSQILSSKNRAHNQRRRNPGRSGYRRLGYRSGDECWSSIPAPAGTSPARRREQSTEIFRDIEMNLNAAALRQSFGVPAQSRGKARFVEQGGCSKYEVVRIPRCNCFTVARNRMKHRNGSWRSLQSAANCRSRTTTCRGSRHF